MNKLHELTELSKIDNDDIGTELRRVASERIASNQRPVISNTAAAGERLSSSNIGGSFTASAEGTPKPPGARDIGDQIEKLIRRAEEVAKLSLTLAIGLAGPDQPFAGRAPRQTKAGDPLFTRQAAGLDEVDRVLESSVRALTRAIGSIG